MSPRKAIQWLRGVERRVNDRRGFFAEHAAEWRQLAEEVARQVLLSNAPADVDAGTWVRWVDGITKSVGAQLVTGDAAGILIYAGRRDPGLGDFAGVIFQDVVDYVAAGRDGDPLGKSDFTTEDSAKTDEQIALNIWGSLQRGNADRMAAVLAHTDDKMGGEARVLFPAILQTWKEVFASKALADLRRWVRRQI